MGWLKRGSSGKPWAFDDLPLAHQHFAGQVILALRFVTALLDLEVVAGSIYLIEGDPLHLLPKGFKVGGAARMEMLRETLLACAAGSRDCDPRPGKAVSQIPTSVRALIELDAGPEATAYSTNAGEAYLQVMVKWAATLNVSDPLLVLALQDWPARSAFETIHQSWAEGSVRGAERLGSDALEESAREQASKLSGRQLSLLRELVSGTFKGANRLAE